MRFRVLDQMLYLFMKIVLNMMSTGVISEKENENVFWNLSIIISENMNEDAQL